MTDELDQKTGECRGCGFDPVLVKDYGKVFYRQHEGPLWLCLLCSGTDAGNAAAYPGSKDAGTVDILRTINYGNNAILAELRGQERRLEKTLLFGERYSSDPSKIGPDPMLPAVPYEEEDES